MVARERARMGLINNIVFVVSQSVEGRSTLLGGVGRWLCFILHPGASCPKTNCKSSLTSVHERSRQGACQCDKSSCHSPGSFLSSLAPSLAPTFLSSHRASRCHLSTRTFPLASTFVDIAHVHSQYPLSLPPTSR